MNIYEIIEKRRSVRSFREDPIEDKTLEKILNAGRMAPSANNSQEYKFVVVKDSQKKKELARIADQRFIALAPIIIAAVSTNPDYMLESGIPAYAVDLAIALDHMTLAAVEEDLGTCWIGSFSQEEAKNILDVPSNFKIAALMPLGVPYDDPGVKSRKNLKDLICYENYEE